VEHVDATGATAKVFKQEKSSDNVSEVAIDAAAAASLQ
jgi:hypothetical protein